MVTKRNLIPMLTIIVVGIFFGILFVSAKPTPISYEEAFAQVYVKELSEKYKVPVPKVKFHRNIYAPQCKTSEICLGKSNGTTIYIKRCAVKSDYLKYLLTHEMAHHIAWSYERNMNHDNIIWRKVMESEGYPLSSSVSFFCKSGE